MIAREENVVSLTCGGSISVSKEVDGSWGASYSVKLAGPTKDEMVLLTKAGELRELREAIDKLIDGEEK